MEEVYLFNVRESEQFKIHGSSNDWVAFLLSNLVQSNLL